MPQLNNGRDIVIDTIQMCLHMLRDRGGETDEVAVLAMTANALRGPILKADLRLAREIAVAYKELVKSSEMKEIIRTLLHAVN